LTAKVWLLVLYFPSNAPGTAGPFLRISGRQIIPAVHSALPCRAL